MRVADSRSRNAGGDASASIVSKTSSADGRTYPAFAQVDSNTRRDFYPFSEAPPHFPALLLFFAMTDALALTSRYSLYPRTAADGQSDDLQVLSSSHFADAKGALPASVA